jgi:hypothetical protein
VDPKQTGFEGVEWSVLAQDRFHWRSLVNTVMAFRLNKGGGFTGS